VDATEQIAGASQRLHLWEVEPLESGWSTGF
jgi:hypothetical protein